MLPATNRGLSGFFRVNSSAACRASSAAFRFSSPTCSWRVELLSEMAVAVERVGLDDVGAGLEVGAVDLLDEFGLGQDQALGAVFQTGANDDENERRDNPLRRVSGRESSCPWLRPE